MNELKPAAELAAEASKPYPNDSAEYRRARTALLAEEIELRRHIERVAAQRRALPPGGEARDYRFLDENGKRSASPTCSAGTTRCSPTSGCTGPSASGRARCARRSSARSTSRRPTSSSASRSRSIGRSPVARQLAFARERGWRNLKFYQTVGDDFARDYRGLAPDGSEWPALDVWVKQRRQGAALLGRRARRHERPRPGPARRARPDAALEHARPDAGAAAAPTGIRSSPTHVSSARAAGR